MDNELSYAWLPTVVWILVALVVVAATASWWWRGGTSPRAVRLAAAGRLAQLSGYWRAVAFRRAALAALAAITVAVVAVAALVAARPVRVVTETEALDARDIVLCLDVSSSMTEEVAAIVAVFDDVSAELDGERIGLVLFNSQPTVVFPLTDDYAAVGDTIGAMRADLDAGALVHELDVSAPTFRQQLGQSRVGDGVMGCIHQFRADAEVDALRGADADSGAPPRSRVVVLATDNAAYGLRQGFDLADAAEYAQALSASVVVLDANRGSEPDATTEQRAELRVLARETGGSVFTPGAATTVSEVVALVESLEAAPVPGDPAVTRYDEPGAPWRALWWLAPLLVLSWAVVRR